jgi:hypothetical protein
LLSAAAIALALLGSCLNTAQAASPARGHIAVSADDSAPIVADDEWQASEDEDFLPVSEDEVSGPAEQDAEPGVASEEWESEEPELAETLERTPFAGAPAAQAACNQALKSAEESGSESPVACVSWSGSASAADLRTAADAWPVPNWCDDHGSNGKWYVNRYKACGIFPADLTVTNPRTGAVVGRMHYLTRAYAYGARDLKTWAYQVELMQVSSSGSGTGSSAGGKGKCNGKCKVTGSTFPSQRMGPNNEAVGQFFLESTIKTTPKGDKGEGQALAAWRFTNPVWDSPSNEISLPTPPVRCDNALPSTSQPGCVMPYIPQMVYAKNGEFPELAKHIEYAQDTKNLPGKHGTNRYLTRLTNSTKRKANRAKACPSSLPRPAGKTCDEYPMASTWQGASTGSGDFSRRMIDKTQNEDGGRALARFYLYNRVIEKDKFQVWIK